MKKLMVIAATSLSLCAVQAYAAKDTALSTQTDRISYTLGADMGANFKKNQIQVNPQALLQGMQDGLAGQKMKMTKQEMTQTLMAFQKQIAAKRQQAFHGLAERNLKEGQAFLTANKAKQGVVTLKDGLQYKVVKAGTGTMPGAKDTVTVNYEGRFVDGKIFDSSFKRGKPATFAVSQVIPGWQQALKLMKTGASWEVYIPAKLAYGAQGIGGVIGPNQTLIFKVDLLSIKDKATQTKT